jgi:GPH family glycoside/pentoside/hexuronide:cation symporter
VSPYRLAAYGALGLPLAMAMMPIYMISPKYYGENLGLNLVSLGAILFLTRLLDTAQDPFLGRVVDAVQSKRFGWPLIAGFASILLAISFVLLFSPPHWSELGLMVWLACCLMALYAAHSLLNICYVTWGTRLSDEPLVRSRVVAWREGLGLLGVVCASVLPVTLVEHYGASFGYRLFAYGFSATLFVALVITLVWTPRPLDRVIVPDSGWRAALAYLPVRRVFQFFLLNAVAVAVPATLVLFFISDVVQRPEDAGLFLGLYFLAGLITLPLWVALADRIGKRWAWLTGSVLAGLALLGASVVGEGDVFLYGVVCLAAGAALGADIALPTSMLADVIPVEQRHHTGLYVGIWVLIGKLALAIAAGVTLPLLGWFDYQPGMPATAAPLVYMYVGFPIALKAVAAVVLFRPCAPPTDGR